MSQSRTPKRGIVIFDSKFGNTEKIAKSLASGLELAGFRTDCINARDVRVSSFVEYGFIAVGAPTQAFTASKPIKEFLSQLEGAQGLKGKYGFAFDTKFRNRLAGSAAKFIEKKLIELGMEIITPRQSAIVKKTEGPLEEREEQAFEQVGFEIGSRIAKDEKIVSSVPAGH